MRKLVVTFSPDFWYERPREQVSFVIQGPCHGRTTIGCEIGRRIAARAERRRLLFVLAQEQWATGRARGSDAVKRPYSADPGAAQGLPRGGGEECRADQCSGTPGEERKGERIGGPCEPLGG